MRQAASAGLTAHCLSACLLRHESFMLLVYANPPLYLCLFSEAQPSSVMCRRDLILLEKIHLYMNLDHKTISSRIIVGGNATHVCQFLLPTSILILK